MSFREFLRILHKNRQISIIEKEVDSDCEIAEIHRRVVEKGGPALLFKRIKGSRFSIVTNLFGSKKRLDLAFPNRPKEKIDRLVNSLFTSEGSFISNIKNTFSNLLFLKNSLTKKVRSGPVFENNILNKGLNEIPFLKTWGGDGGEFLTLPVVHTRSLHNGIDNLGMYRVQRFSDRECSLHFQIQKGAGFHYYEAQKQDRALPVNIYLGASPAVIFASIAPLPENVSEILFAGLLQGSRLKVSKHKTEYPVFVDSEFLIEGEAPVGVLKNEGPFGDHYGYYDKKGLYPVLHCKNVYHRNNAICPATVVGQNRQEDCFIGDFLQDLLSPLIGVAMPTLKSLWSYYEAGYHSLAAAIIQERYEREALVSAFRILGEGQCSLTKFLFLTDQEVDVKNFKQVLSSVLERFDVSVDLRIIASTSADSLDPGSKERNKGSKVVFIGVGKNKRTELGLLVGFKPSFVDELFEFVPGCLIITVFDNLNVKDNINVFSNIFFKNIAVIIILDNIVLNTSIIMRLAFSTCDPDSDIFTTKSKVGKNHIIYGGVVVIDSRRKEHHAKLLEVDSKTKEKVDCNWDDYNILL